MKRVLSLGLFVLLTSCTMMSTNAWAQQKHHWWQFNHNTQNNSSSNQNQYPYRTNHHQGNRVRHSNSSQVRNMPNKEHWWSRRHNP